MVRESGGWGGGGTKVRFGLPFSFFFSSPFYLMLFCTSSYAGCSCDCGCALIIKPIVVLF